MDLQRLGPFADRKPLSNSTVTALVAEKGRFGLQLVPELLAHQQLFWTSSNLKKFSFTHVTGFSHLKITRLL